MSAPGFTPGPWEVRPARDAAYLREPAAVDLVDPNGRPIVRLKMKTRRRDGEVEEMAWIEIAPANADLILAAPDLYDVLTGILRLNGSRLDPDLVDAARAALAKAEGSR